MTHAESLATLMSFVQEALSALTEDSFSVDLAKYDLANPVSLQEAQEAQIKASQYVNSLTEKTEARYADFKILEELVSMLFNQFRVDYISLNPKIRGLDKEVYAHQLEVFFNEREQFDLSMIRQVTTRFTQLKNTLEYRRENLKQIYFTIKNQFKIYESSFSTHQTGVVKFPTQSIDSTQPMSAPMPRARVSPIPIPPPAGVPQLPPEFQRTQE